MALFHNIPPPLLSSRLRSDPLKNRPLEWSLWSKTSVQRGNPASFFEFSSIRSVKIHTRVGVQRRDWGRVFKKILKKISYSSYVASEFPRLPERFALAEVIMKIPIPTSTHEAVMMDLDARIARFNSAMTQKSPLLSDALR